jgi:hypothetical protein
MEHLVRFLQEPQPETGDQPDLWEFYESAYSLPAEGGAGWFDVFWVAEFATEVPCETVVRPPLQLENFDDLSVCYHTNLWLNEDTNWLRARAVAEVPYELSGWSEPLYVSEPPSTLVLLMAIMMLVFLKRFRRG